MQNRILSFISLGCDKNLVDSEKMLGILSEQGYSFTDDVHEAEVCIINTCSFINDAKEESIQNILDVANLKQEGKLKALIVTGCLAQRYAEEIQEEIPEVDAIVGINSFHRICEVVEEVLENKSAVVLDDLSILPAPVSKRVITTGGHFAYLKISEGCAKHCTYCAIPKIRGNYRSYPMEYLIDEAKKLAQEGVKELIIVAQETTLYGVDIYGKKMLPELLNKLCEIPEFVWIRILYCYPEEITDELIACIKANKKICNYLDIPMQHCSDKILKRMGRRTSKADIKALINKLRTEIPDIAVRTTFIVGFPGETEEDFNELLEFVDEMSFDRVGVFTYSPEEDTPAASFSDQVSEEEKIRRKDELMILQQAVSTDIGEETVGKKLLVMIEGKLPDESVYVGRTYKDAPDVDGYIFVYSQEELMSGDFAFVTVTGSMEYDLIGEIDNELT